MVRRQVMDSLLHLVGMVHRLVMDSLRHREVMLRVMVPSPRLLMQHRRQDLMHQRLGVMERRVKLQGAMEQRLGLLLAMELLQLAGMELLQHREDMEATHSLKAAAMDSIRHNKEATLRRAVEEAFLLEPIPKSQGCSRWRILIEAVPSMPTN